MRKQVLIAVLVAAGLGGCAATRPAYVEYHGGEVQVGRGGAMKVVDGVELWSDGSPPRKHRIIAMTTRSSNAPGSVSSRVILDVKAAGGDAAVQVSATDKLLGVGKGGSAEYETLYKYAIIKYVN